MKRIMFLLAILVATVLQSEAQQRRERGDMDPEKMAERVAGHMEKELELSEEQKKEVYALFLESSKKRMEMRNQEKEEREAAREQMIADRKAQQAKLKEILSEEQFAKWEEMQRKMQERMRERGGDRPKRGDGA
ncbi:DUF4890 domain-containing protein [Echinicola marina]|uniref:DUF4890 domain-containing protein n=1 Tax=Echinicola marina TaxID=2859768 RepID=UPI001CF68E0E|nr:DUF4890 domain-containing protein [Echinicola marina]UCS94424.1 DUF4890 domain-containing protein [Echinicola marina]